MKTGTTNNLLLLSSMALAVMATIFTSVPAWSAEHAEGKEIKMGGKMMENCQQLKKEKKEMKAEMKAQDAELTAAIVTMNDAEQDKKIDLLAGVVTRLVNQRTAMHERKAKMEERMMKHMMEHMEMGKESMSKCPMMKEMNEKSDAARAEHHEKSE